MFEQGQRSRHEDSIESAMPRDRLQQQCDGQAFFSTEVTTGYLSPMFKQFGSRELNSFSLPEVS
jgi:hypothetical protein